MLIKLKVIQMWLMLILFKVFQMFVFLINSEVKSRLIKGIPVLLFEGLNYAVSLHADIAQDEYCEEQLQK